MYPNDDIYQNDCLYIKIFYAIFSSAFFISFIFQMDGGKMHFSALFFIVEMGAIFLMFLYSYYLCREQVQKFFFNDPKFYYFMIYSFFFCVSIFIVQVISLGSSCCTDSNFFHTILQIQAALLGIIFAVAIILLQLLTQEYSARLNEFLKHLWDWKIIGFFYAISIILNVFVLCTKTCESIPYFFSLIFSAYTIIILIPYAWNTIIILSPYNQLQLVQKKLTDPIVNDSFFEYKKFDIYLFDTYLQIFSDLLNKSLLKLDFKSLSMAYTELDCMLIIYKKEKNNIMIQKLVIRKLFFYFVEFKGLINEKTENNLTVKAIVIKMEEFFKEWPNIEFESIAFSNKCSPENPSNSQEK